MVQFDIATHPVKQTVALVSRMLKSMIAINDACGARSPSCFHSRSIPTIGVEEYLLRILKYTPFNNECLLSALIYLDRIVRCSKETASPFAINSYNIHRLLVTGIVIASKYSSDVYFTNSRYAQVAGITLGDLNALELEFLFLSKFDLMVHPLDLLKFGNHLLLSPQPTASHAPTRSRMVTPPPECETPLKSAKTSVSLYVDDLADLMQNTNINRQKLDSHTINALRKNLLLDTGRPHRSALPSPPLLDNSLLEALFNPQNQVPTEKQQKFLMLLHRCSKKILTERNRPMVKRLVRS
ncbi:cyclin-domain-containing protein [Basidiobolus meristosporus CBS 931.73]|uniref:Cyclin-domain-containing protein n=1 Tax=Basidiobolus meristosporus CBS 931.73 TaxID=1314790 RepID=A0A1Y1XTX7_9FUNG|nr:cyclin-domain-containing protein [Basidiobolus meristosporus CBS 931.73]|eukprot:ORX89200.1 cyclin-domain-containing protein [Basidiobolus meristosporus CBS 931.73]